MVARFWHLIFPILTHPAMLEALLLSFWTQWHPAWILASWSLLVGVNGGLYLLIQRASSPPDIILLFREPRRFLLFMNLLFLLAFRAATAEPLLAFWLNYLIWHGVIAFCLHLYKRYSLHAQAWAGLSAFYVYYGVTYPHWALIFSIAWIIVIYQRYQTKAHTLQEISLGSGVGMLSSWAFLLI